MRIGILPTIDRTAGGIYQYGLSMLEALRSLQHGEVDDNEFVLCYADPVDRSTLAILASSWRSVPIYPLASSQERDKAVVHSSPLETLRHFVGEGPHRNAWRSLRDRLTPGWRGVDAALAEDLPHPDRVRSQPEIRDWLQQHGIQLMLYPAPLAVSFECGVPYIMAIHDLQHQLQPEFPEVSADGEWERREYLFRNGARYATLLLADSEVGREDIIRFYGPHGVAPDRVKVLPFLPAHYLARAIDDAERMSVLASLGILQPYLFYPAQFWPHKNHARIIQALGRLRSQDGLEIDLVLAGSASGDLRQQMYDEAMHLAQDLGVADRLHCPGYVPEAHMAALYVGARALIMPTFFGPTNIPPLEAWSLGCPVITSDIRGIREQMGDAAILVDPRSVESIAAGIAQVWRDEGLRQELSARGRKRLAEYTPEDFRRRLQEILIEAKERVLLGDVPARP